MPEYTDAELAAAAVALRDADYASHRGIAEGMARTVLDAVTPLIAARVRRQAADEVAELRQAIRPPSATWDRGWYDALTAASVSLRRTSPDSGTAPPTDHDETQRDVTTSEEGIRE